MSRGAHEAPRAFPRPRVLRPRLSVHASTGTLEAPPTVAVRRVAPAPATPNPSSRREPSRPPVDRSSTTWLVSTSLLMLAGLLLGFVFQVVVVSQVQQTRSQQVLLSDFRADLANAVAPVGQTDIDGQLLAPGTPVAILSIPRLDVSQVVVEGTTSGQTLLGPGHLRSTPLPGQAGVSVVYGRQAAFGGPFGGLANLQPGDEILVTTGQAADQKYTVIGVRREGDPVPAPPASGEGRLTLVTATGTPYMPDAVLRVDARLTSEVQPAGTRVLGPASLGEAEQPMAGDPAAWVSVLLWTQLLLVAVLGLTWVLARIGRWQTWVIGIPIVGLIGLALGNQVVQLLPNLI